LKRSAGDVLKRNAGEIASLIALFSVSMIGVGVFLGAPKPIQPNAS